MKELLVVGGPNGSGKSTFVEEVLKRRNDPFLSADLIATELAPSTIGNVHVAAGREFLRRLRDRLAGDESLIVESTLSGRGFLRTLQSAKRAGFQVILTFVFLSSADACVERVRERVRKGGHGVPEADIRRRFRRSLANFWNLYRPLADVWVLVHNGAGFRDVAAGNSGQPSVRDGDLFREFQLLAGVDSNG